LALAFLGRAGAQELGQLDSSPTLFTVMAAINAAGFDADLDSPNGHPLRKAIRDEIAKRNIPSLPALKEFFQKHHKRTPAEELSQYISFALTVQGPPTFAMGKRVVEIPPDVSGLNGLSPLLAAFYKEANIDDLWKRSQPAIDSYLRRYHQPVTDAVMQVNGYLRQPTSGFRGRRFQIFIELLAPPNIVQSRSYGNEEFVVITPSPTPRVFEVRHAYLHYLLDPLATRAREVLERKKGLADHSQRAGILSDVYKIDFLELTTACLIRAVESRLDHKPEMVQEALLDGYILTPYFAERLPVFEKQEASMQVYYPEMVGGIDLYKEDARLSKVQFRVPEREKPAEAPPTPAETTLKQADDLAYKNPPDLEQAKKLYLDVLQMTDQKPVHAAAYYGMARIAALQKDPETAERLFQKVLELQPEPTVKAWTLVFLGKLSMAAAAGDLKSEHIQEAAAEREQAARYFQDALKVEGAPKKALEEAQQGVQNSSKP
jgi:tetratricopeptide (TPR) repeat protein